MAGRVKIFTRDYRLLVGIVYSVLVGIVGTILLVGFLATILDLFTVIRLIPWIVAFNTLIGGYSLLDKTRNELQHKYLSAAVIGITTTLLIFIVLKVLFLFTIERYYFATWQLILLIIIGTSCAELGAILAIKYLELEQ